MAKTKDIIAVATPVLIVLLAAVTALKQPDEPKPKPDKVLVVCSYESPDDRDVTYVVEGRDCGACRRHPLYGKSGAAALELTGCYRQVQRGETTFASTHESDEPLWTAAEDEAAVCDKIPTQGITPHCESLKTQSFACRRHCHRDPDCNAMCRSRCDVPASCRKDGHQNAKPSGGRVTAQVAQGG